MADRLVLYQSENLHLYFEEKLSENILCIDSVVNFLCKKQALTTAKRPIYHCYGQCNGLRDRLFLVLLLEHAVN